MASTKFYITAGLIPKDDQGEDGSTKFYITAGLVKDDPAAAPVGVSPQYYLRLMRGEE